MSVISLTNRFARSPGDPQIQEVGPSARVPGDGLAKALGWFSLGLGLMEMLAPGTIAPLGSVTVPLNEAAPVCA